MEGCVFCKIVRGELPSRKEYENDDVIAFRNIKPAASIHLLIIPKKHIFTFHEMSQKDGKVFLEMMKAAQRLIQKMKLEEGYKLIINGGEYQFVPHLHWHLLAGEIPENFAKNL
ncbi:hypothetical protein A3D00_01755 [Candidatus Woesebacteria bacterium RIFCSPHIGHO2_02_FULL_38_9]|uniref:HIT domain-containing protein n=1 Tax=Candidatus Woesebacteria bacterium RIFCSPHIGHO2_01_FULL_39_28 TaxID=1802496 RepID=A0A1F7YHQ7_9BACT|nr:MAG: hypothetical protein A2627_03695 [Candidatus Woesebacteria bacterium RIFCSPHIGHO2_01_FULL_39_28]OGM33653.1 MAG: hypothetical protein A3D00_01755 [Candidatus Woesebacteria bacterium RIFCSPHIGHO2_02_FULL_38_9]OGM58526.1 MAG: hypothetical protein A3A50_00705 [Candidatus Woesebacteria bacterium RIFCSPLOWO2_01_FULL_38_20]